jgi:crotonobetainyl-CoA:carnitine CoA-transferase CaiB-like acyl-CoA transferase
MSEQNTGPLAGVRVVEICNTIAGPACTRLMADFGADVVKIEPLSGDPVRQVGAQVDHVSLYGSTILRGKRCIAVDLKTPEGRQLAFDLASRADIVVENNRPGVMERLGLGYDALKAANPGLVMVRISGYGQDGPYADRPGYGAICEGFGGVRHMTGDPDRPPARVALATTDYLSSVYAAFGAMTALHHRRDTGVGQIVDVALYEAAFSQMESVIPAFDKLGQVPMRQGPNLPGMAPNSLYPTRDGGYVLIAANSDTTFLRLARAMGQPRLATEARFATVRSRGVPEHARALDALIGAWTASLDGEAVEASLREQTVPVSRVYTIEDIFRDPHYRAREMLVDVPHPVLGSITQMGVMPKLSATPGAVRHAGPEIGADTDAVLGELGLPPERIAALREAGIVGVPAPVNAN